MNNMTRRDFLKFAAGLSLACLFNKHIKLSKASNRYFSNFAYSENDGYNQGITTNFSYNFDNMFRDVFAEHGLSITCADDPYVSSYAGLEFRNIDFPERAALLTMIRSGDKEHRKPEFGPYCFKVAAITYKNGERVILDKPEPEFVYCKEIHDEFFDELPNKCSTYDSDCDAFIDSVTEAIEAVTRFLQTKNAQDAYWAFESECHAQADTLVDKLLCTTAAEHQ